MSKLYFSIIGNPEVAGPLEVALGGVPCRCLPEEEALVL